MCLFININKTITTIKQTEINTYRSPIQHSSLLDFLKPSTHPIIYTRIHRSQWNH